MKYLFLIAVFNAFFFSILLLQKKKAYHDKVLIVWLFYLGAYIGSYSLFSETLFVDYHLLSAIFISMLMLHGPFLYLYISALVNENPRLTQKDLIHFAPFVLFNAFLLISTIFPEFSKGIRLDHVETAHKTPLLFNFFLLLTVLSGPVYFVLSFRLFRKLDASILDNFSKAENIDLDWLKKLVYSFGGVWTILILFTSIHHAFHFFSWAFCTNGLFFSLSFFVILVGYFGLKQKEVFIQYPDQKIEYVIEPKKKYAGVLLKEEDSELYLNKINRFMIAEKPYMDANLTLPELATKLAIPSHHLSRVINEKLGLNFFDFINQYRVEEVKAKVTDPEYNHLSLLGIAFESGFNTKSAFNRVFKNATGLTPSEYKSQF